MKKWITSLGVLLAAATAPVAYAGGDGHEHAGDLIVGRTDTGELAIEFDFEEPIVLQPTSGLLSGWALDEPGMDVLEEDEPDEDFYQLPLAADVVFVVTSVDPGLKMWLAGFVEVLDSAGDEWHLGSVDTIHQHGTWHIDSNDPGFNPSAGPWSMSFQLVDRGMSAYSDSPIYTMTFVPEPGSLALLSLGAFAVRRRRIDR
jgi:hypothetical protein